MTQDTNPTTGTNRFEKNSYFYGKLLSVRDMAAEQAYHIGVRRTLTRFVDDWGSLCGLNVETHTDTDQETGKRTLTVVVTPGIALDRCGRLVVIEDPQERTLTLSETEGGVDPSDISVYVEYDECETDPVPVAKMESACDEECEPNRIVQGATVTVESGIDDSGKSVTDVSFPDGRTLGAPFGPGGQEIRIRGDVGIEEADTDHTTRVELDATLDDTAPSGTIEVDLGTSKPDARPLISGGISFPPDTIFGPDGFSAPTGEFDVIGTLDIDGSTHTLSGSVTASQESGGVSFDGRLTHEGPDGQTTDLDVSLSLTPGDGGLSIDARVDAPEISFVADGFLDTGTVDAQYVLSGGAAISVADGESIGGVSTLEWGDDSTYGGVLVDAPTTGNGEGAGDGVQDVLTSLARSYYEQTRRDDCPEVDSGRVLVGMLRSEGTDWQNPSFERGPLVYSNDMLYDILARHVSDFDNPHEVALGVGSDTDANDAQIGIEEADGLTHRVDLTSTDDTISITSSRIRGRIDLSAPGHFSTTEREYLVFERSLWSKMEAYTELVRNAPHYQVPQDVRVTARHIVEATQRAIDDGVYESRDQYVQFIAGPPENYVEATRRVRIAQPASMNMLVEESFEPERIPLIELEADIVESLTFTTKMDRSVGDFVATTIDRLRKRVATYYETGDGAEALALAQDRVAKSVHLLLTDAPTISMWGGEGSRSAPTGIGRDVVPEVTMQDYQADEHATATRSVSELWQGGWVHEINPVERNTDTTKALAVPVNAVRDQSPDTGTRATKPATVQLDVVQAPEVERLTDIGSGRSPRLSDVGIDYVSELAATNPSVLRVLFSFSMDRASKVHAQARGYARAYDFTRFAQVGIEEAEIFYDAMQWDSIWDLSSGDYNALLESVSGEDQALVKAIDWEQLMADVDAYQNQT